MMDTVSRSQIERIHHLRQNIFEETSLQNYLKKTKEIERQARYSETNSHSSWEMNLAVTREMEQTLLEHGFPYFEASIEEPDD
jgi:hypothetical protein